MLSLPQNAATAAAAAPHMAGGTRGLVSSPPALGRAVGVGVGVCIGIDRKPPPHDGASDGVMFEWAQKGDRAVSEAPYVGSGSGEGGVPATWAPDDAGKRQKRTRKRGRGHMAGAALVTSAKQKRIIRSYFK